MVSPHFNTFGVVSKPISLSNSCKHKPQTIAFLLLYANILVRTSSIFSLIFPEHTGHCFSGFSKISERHLEHIVSPHFRIFGIISSSLLNFSLHFGHENDIYFFSL